VGWRGLRHRDVGEPAVREAIERFCEKIVQALRKPGISPERNNERLKPNNESRPRQAEEEKRRDQAARQAAEEQGWYEPARSANLASRKVACNELRNLRDRKTMNTLTACWWMVSNFALYYFIWALFATHLQLDLALGTAQVAIAILLANTFRQPA